MGKYRAGPPLVHVVVKDGEEVTEEFREGVGGGVVRNGGEPVAEQVWSHHFVTEGGEVVDLRRPDGGRPADAVDHEQDWALILHHLLLLKLQLLLFLLLSQLLLDSQRGLDHVPLPPISDVCLVLRQRRLLFGTVVDDPRFFTLRKECRYIRGHLHMMPAQKG